MNITESYLIDIMRQEYNKRLNHFLDEKLDIKYLKSPEGLKVKDAEGHEYTLSGFVQKAGKVYAKLWLSTEPRFDVKNIKQKRLLNTQKRDNTITSEDFDKDVQQYADDTSDVYSNDEDVVDLETSDASERKFKLVPREEFLKDYKLS